MGSGTVFCSSGTVLLGTLCLLDSIFLRTHQWSHYLWVAYSERIFQISKSSYNVGSSQVEFQQEGGGGPLLCQLLGLGEFQGGWERGGALGVLGPWVYNNWLGVFQCLSTDRLIIHHLHICEYLDQGQAPLKVLEPLFLFLVIAYSIEVHLMLNQDLGLRGKLFPSSLKYFVG